MPHIPRFSQYKTIVTRNIEVVKTACVSLIFITLFIFSLRKGFVAGMPGFGDAWPFPPTINESVKTFISAWDTRNPQIDMPAVTVISFLTVVEAFVGFLFGGDMTTPARLFYFYLPIPLMFIAMYWFLGVLGFSRIAKFFASFIYAANFVVVGELLGGFPGTMYVQILFPLLVYNLFKKRFFLFSLLLAVAYIFSDHVLIISLPFFLSFVTYELYKRKVDGLIKSIGFVVGSGIIVFLLTLPYTYFYLKVSLPFLGGGLRDDVLAFLIRNVHDTYRYYTVGNAIRLGGSAYSNLFNGDDFWARLGFLIPALSFLWFIFPSNRKGKKLVLGTTFSGLVCLIAVFLYLTHKYITVPLFIEFPFLFRFRNPARLTLFLAFAYSPLIALTLDGVYSLFYRFRRLLITPILTAFTVVIVVVVSLYLKPFFSGDFTFSKNRGVTYTIAPRYYVIKEWLSSQRYKDGDFRTLWVPYNHEEVEMKIRYIDPQPFSVPINYGSYVDNLYLNNMKSVYKGFVAENPFISSSLGRSGVRYIILNTLSSDSGPARFEYDYLTPWLLGDPLSWEKKIKKIKDLREVGRIENFLIFENTKYRKELVERELAGYPPDGEELKIKTIIISAISFLVVLFGIERELRAKTERRFT